MSSGEPFAALLEIADLNECRPQLQALVGKALVKIRDEFFLLARADIVEIVVCRGVFQQGLVFLLVGGARVVEYHQGYGVAVTPEVIVIRFDGVADFAQPVSWDYEEQLFRLHAVFRV